jgi:phage/plasmid-associated DNA primase
MSAAGNYGYTLPSSVLLGAVKDGANPAIANMSKKRFCLASEPNGKKKICSATLKEITGNAKMNSRGLYSDNTDVILQLSLFLECNKVPDIDEVGVGVERRFDMFDFISRFVEPNKYSEFTEEEIKSQHIFIGNPYYITDPFKVKYRQALIEILLEYFKIFRENNYQFPEKPKECKEKAKQYLANSDEIYSWFCSYYQKCDEGEENIFFVDDLYDIIKCSQFFELMTKEAKRNFNITKFKSMVNENIFLKAIIKEPRTYYKGVRQTKQYIINYKKIENQKNEPEDETDEESLDL